jgi:hypothetical protein
MPMIKISEMYYIAAECLALSNPSLAVDRLNAVRTSRGITSKLSNGLTSSAVMSEIRKEYIKEFPCEGQLFFYKKRTLENQAVWPLPQNEINYGN